MTPNDRIKHIRCTLGLTQTEFSKRIAISVSYLAGIETNFRRVNDRIARLIVNEFNVNEYWIKTGDGEMFNEDSNVCMDNVISLFETLSPYHKMCALQQIEALVDLEDELVLSL